MDTAKRDSKHSPRKSATGNRNRENVRQRYTVYNTSVNSEQSTNASSADMSIPQKRQHPGSNVSSLLSSYPGGISALPSNRSNKKKGEAFKHNMAHSYYSGKYR